MLSFGRNVFHRKGLGGVEVRAKVLLLVPVIVSVLTFSSSLWAHHASRQVYEGKSITLMGVVTDYEWANPHSVLSVAVEGGKGNVEEWHAEIRRPTATLGARWAKEGLEGGRDVHSTGRRRRVIQC